ncbi:MAG TPA: hypothetical protein VM012_09965 [Flavitalea sp.]|nr:hypothetical protein [Flavitalea sp.]
MKKCFATAALFFLLVIVRSQNVGIGTNTPLEKLSVGNTSQFRVDANGNITRINNLPYSFPAIQGTANSFLRNDGAGNLSWSAINSAKPIVRTFNITGDGFAWNIDNAGDYNATPFNINPQLILYRGFTYQFNINAPGHPFRIAVSNGGAPYTPGVTNNDQSIGVITFTVPMDAPNTLHYYCTIHAIMNGPVIIR